MPEQVILASASPRRKDLLEGLGFSVKIVPSNMEETMRKDESPDNFVKRMAREKVLTVVSRLKQTMLPEHFAGGTDEDFKRIEQYIPARWVVGADTIVVVDNEILGKPLDNEEAFIMLQRLSGRTHTVITGFCIYDILKDKEGIQAVITKVRFKKLANREIEKYVSLGEGLDKAGSYAIQGAGAYLVETIDGSYTNVVGLPLCQLVEIMQEMRADDVLPF